ncbi:AraC family transcriptional regulator [Photobacterium sanctipauli]|uniref:AraC family transcriptional regulator n=1 Tax=Photobacterium sanctipauli TaxID=1342794 RepID=A0A2T3NAJ5_9GAMM|nr:AraC family transcriptional regulator [Photobacterium sanctipauli]PSW10758.1 AraC family transcriptional regulator [Photobacterium sanctipauli]
MCQRVIANTPEFSMFDLQKIEETKHMIFGADYIVIRPLRGECSLQLANNRFTLRPGTIVLLAPFNPFRLSLGPQGHTGGGDCDVLHFRLNALGATFVDSVQFKPIKQMLDSASNALYFEGSELDEVHAFIDSMENTFDFSQVLNLLGLLESLSTLKSVRHLTNNTIELNTIKRAEERVNVVQQYIANNLSEHLSVSSVAAQLHMADSTFSRFFHANLGVTFRQYVIEQRVRKAASLLISTDYSISQIGADVGFSSLSNFNAKFKSLLHVTPREYRANHIDMRRDIENSRVVEGQINRQMSELMA